MFFCTPDGQWVDNSIAVTTDLVGSGEIYRCSQRTTLGDIPVIRRKCLARWLWSENPADSAILCGCARRTFAPSPRL